MNDMAIVWYNSVGDEFGRYEFNSMEKSEAEALEMFAMIGDEGRSPNLSAGDTIKIEEL